MASQNILPEDHEMLFKQRLKKVKMRKVSKTPAKRGKQTVIKINEETALNLAESSGRFLGEEHPEDYSSLQVTKSESDWKNKYGALKNSQFKDNFFKNLEENDKKILDGSTKCSDTEKIETIPEVDEELFNNLSSKCSQKEYEVMKESRSQLPIWKMKDEILKAIQENPVVVVCGETGCGKTTQVVQYLLDEAIELRKGSNFRAVCTQPRRVAATSVAQRVADERHEPCGTPTSSVGYQIRLEQRTPRQSGSILFCTTGILVQFLQSDPLLKQFSHVLIDEIHERDLMTDFLLTIVRDLLPRRPNLRVILMSATINSDIFSCYFNNCPVVNVPGQIHGVEVHYLEDILTKLDFRIRSQKLKRANRLPTESDALSKTLDFEYKNLMEPFIKEMEDKRSYPLHVFKSLRRRESEEAPELLIISLLKHVCSSEGDGAILIFLPGMLSVVYME